MSGRGLSLADLGGFHEQFAPTSRLVKEEGRLFEQVYRAEQPGLHAARLSRAAEALQRAAALAGPDQRAALTRLALSLRSNALSDPHPYLIHQLLVQGGYPVLYRLRPARAAMAK